MRRIMFLTVVIAALIAGGSGAVAQEKKSTNAAPAAAAAPAKRLPFRGTIASVDANEKTITLQGEKQQVIHITAQTRIVKDTKVAGFEALTPGAKVQGNKNEVAEGKWDATMIKITEDKKAAPAKTAP